MTCYVKKARAVAALKKMSHFYIALATLYKKHGLTVNEDIGRRNILMSSLQEKYFAEEIDTTFPGTVANGKTGEPDIIIPALNRELECKLTSKNRSGSWALQSDYNTLRRKGAVDHLYVLASDDFDEFAVLFFEGLTVKDFHPPASGSKGKSRINFRHALAKCTVVFGEMNDKSEQFLLAAGQVLADPTSTHTALEKARARIDYWSTRSNISFGLEAL